MITADMYELSPMQQGMLYHTLEDASRSGMYSIVVSYTLHGPLDRAAFARAWQLVVDRHPILRTSFHWQDGREPRQVVHPGASLTVWEDDWRPAPEEEIERRLDDWLDAEAERGFDLQTPPLMRLSLIQRADAIHEFVLAHHHLLMDGSCKPLLFQEVFEAYEAFRLNQPMDLAPAPPYREFIEWLRDQDMEEAERFWRAELSGVSAPTPLWDAASTAQADEPYAERAAVLDRDASDALRQFARRNRITLNTIVTGLWAVLLSRSSGQDSVVFGATVNGRPPDLEGADSMLGLFINTLPVRAHVDPGEATTTWLQRLQAHQAASRDYDFAPLSKIQRWSAVPRGTPLFESIVVFENNAGYGLERERYGLIEIGAVRPVIQNSLPLTLRCVPGRELAIQLLYETKRFSAQTIAAIADDLVQLLRDLPSEAGPTLAHLCQRLDEIARSRGAMQAEAFHATSLDKLRRLKRGGRTIRTHP